MRRGSADRAGQSGRERIMREDSADRVGQSGIEQIVRRDGADGVGQSVIEQTTKRQKRFGRFSGKGDGGEAIEQSVRYPSRMDWRGLCAAAAGLFMMAYGIYRGEMKDVFEKAINICLECIGIG